MAEKHAEHPRHTGGPRDASRGPRLQKILAQAGVGSRRACETIIEQGRVSVNGGVIDSLPAWADPEADRIEVDGRPLGRPRKRSHLYLLVNKPRRVLCTNADPQGRTRIIDMVPHDQRLFCVGRLDADSTGLVLLTDDGPLAHRLTHPRFEIPKTYETAIRGRLSDEDIEQLQSGIWLAEKSAPNSAPGTAPVPGAAPGAAKARAASVQLISRDREKTRLLITLTEGRNREIRRMLARLGHNVRRLKRVSLGPLRLKGVGPGQWRPLTRPEVATLRQSAKRATRQQKKQPPV